VLIIEPIPGAARLDPLVCLSKATVREECRYAVKPMPDPLERLYRQLADPETGVFSADFDRLVCPFLPICDPIVDNQIVKFDSTHITDKFAVAIAPQVDEYLKQTAIIPR
jgi:hypothetical protein